jgi:L-ascorbate metabolism protein UlaG (beta-lactamase superfamily)
VKVTFIGHAAILIETRGISILSDPWWDHPFFGAQWWNYPRAVGRLAEDRKLDYIYISHGHHDHLHPGTLAKLNRSAKVLIAAGTNLAADIAKVGFEVIEVRADEACELGNGVTCRIMPTYSGDSLMVVTDGREVCANLNDSFHSAPADVQAQFVARLRALYPAIDYVFCGYGVGSNFPTAVAFRARTRLLRQLRASCTSMPSGRVSLRGSSPGSGCRLQRTSCFSSTTCSGSTSRPTTPSVRHRR